MVSVQCRKLYIYEIVTESRCLNCDIKIDNKFIDYLHKINILMYTRKSDIACGSVRLIS